MVSLPHIWWFNKAAQVLKNVSPVMLSILGIIAWWLNLVEIVVVGGIYTIAGVIDGLDVSAFKDASFAAFDYLGYANAVFPLSESFAALSAYAVAWGGVIMVRWIKSFIPTMAN